MTAYLEHGTLPVNRDPGAWHTARPFRHVLLDLPPGVAAVLGVAAREFPPPSDPGWHTFTGERERGKQEGRAEIAGMAVRDVHRHLASAAFVTRLRQITLIEDLMPDPYRVGGGIHQSAEGAHLDVHHDFTVHPMDPALERRVNVLLFLSPEEWTPDMGGELLLVGDVATGDVVMVAPTRGTLLAFEASDHSWHGHPRPWCSATPRRSIPAYYYAPRREGVEATSTVWFDEQ